MRQRAAAAQLGRTPKAVYPQHHRLAAAVRHCYVEKFFSLFFN
jgi:hypothetical protein